MTSGPQTRLLSVPGSEIRVPASVVRQGPPFGSQRPRALTWRDGRARAPPGTSPGWVPNPARGGLRPPDGSTFQRPHPLRTSPLQVRTLTWESGRPRLSDPGASCLRQPLAKRGPWARAPAVPEMRQKGHVLSCPHFTLLLGTPRRGAGCL